MPTIDQFESVFKAADKEVFAHRDIEIKNILVISDGDEDAHATFKEKVTSFLSVLGDELTWHDAKAGDFDDLQALLELVQKVSPELVCTYRNLRSNAWQWPYSLGDDLNVLTQETNVPILVLPHPKKEGKEWPQEPLREIMAVTDHLTGDDRLVNYAAKFTPEDGTLFLAHIEDAEAYDRMIELISKIPELDTEVAKVELQALLLKETREYIGTCQAALQAAGLAFSTQAVIEMGHFLSDYQEHIKAHKVDLLVLNTKDDDQLAMHGLAYPIAVEFRDLPLLML